MIKERTLEVIQFLNKERLASYKEIAKELGYQERVIRYEIERINDELSLSGFEEIQKRESRLFSSVFYLIFDG